jgi:hypothetical protein
MAITELLLDAARRAGLAAAARRRGRPEALTEMVTRLEALIGA